MCGSHQLCRPPGHKQHTSGQTLSRVCRAWGQVTQSHDQRSNDSLSGLKENVIIGTLIPAGTGSNAYQSMKPSLPDDKEKQFLGFLPKLDLEPFEVEKLEIWI